MPLARRLGFYALLFIGIGDILGAGIYALVGKVVGIAGTGAWISFLIAALLAAVTGLSYAELSSRIPKAAGASAYAGAAFTNPLIPFLTGFLIMASGLTSTATIALAIQGYLDVIVPIPGVVATLGMIALLTWIAWRGINFSAWTNNVLAVFEISGLMLIIGVGISLVLKMDAAQLMTRLQPGPSLSPLLSGATLAFYAFIGFEDLANLAEESKNPERDLPRAILGAVAITTVIYLTVIAIVLCVVPAEQAATSARPLLEILAIAGHPLPASIFALLALSAVTNTGLANFVMVSRLLYGMSGQGLMPQALGRVDSKRQIPTTAILVTTGLVILLVATGGTRLLAQTTSLLLVIAFTVVHLSLIRIRARDKREDIWFRAPRFVPWSGIMVSLFLLCYFPSQAYVRALVILATGTALYIARRKLSR